MTNIVRISRPRFWIYLFGPYLIGLAAGATGPEDFLRPDSILFAIYFLLPANLLVYGINDIFDFETDRLNPKKSDYEVLVRPEDHRSLWIWIAILNVPFLLAILFFAPGAIIPVAVFILLSVFYSAPPIRAKEVSFLDSIFNILYVFPGVFAFRLLTGEFPPAGIIFAGGLWTAAMHAYSAIPDIEPDTAVGLETIATKLGSWGTHMFCIVCYFVAAVVVSTFAVPIALIGFSYVGLMSISVYGPSPGHVFSVYRWFPVINAVCGSLIFWYVAWPKLH